MGWVVTAEHGKEAQDQLEMGIKVEMEHADTIRWLAKKLGPGPGYDEKAMEDLVKEAATKIAQDHLKELPDYYSRLKKMEAS